MMRTSVPLTCIPFPSSSGTNQLFFFFLRSSVRCLREMEHPLETKSLRNLPKSLLTVLKLVNVTVHPFTLSQERGKSRKTQFFQTEPRGDHFKGANDMWEYCRVLVIPSLHVRQQIHN